MPYRGAVLERRMVAFLLMGLACGRPSPPPEAPQATAGLAAGVTDVVLVVACTLRRDRLDLYGAGRPTAPFLARLGAEGVVFEDHVTQAPWTRPSVGSIVTGRWPRVLHLDRPGVGRSFDLALGGAHTTLAEYLRTAGYQTFAVTANPNTKADFGFGQGVDAMDEPAGTWREGDGGQRPSGELVDAALAHLARLPGDRRVFAWLVVTDTHQPRQFEPGDLEAVTGGTPGTDLRLDRYDASLRHLDRSLERLHREWTARRPNTLWVVVSDHGEGLDLPPHHGRGHGRHLYMSTIGGVGVWHHPALPAGRRVGALTRNIDVVPTVLGLLGLPAASPVDGLDLSGLVRGSSEEGAPYAVAETFFREADAVAWVDGRWHLVQDRATGRNALYARTDPAATRDLATRQTTAVRELTGALERWELAVAREASAWEAEEQPLDEATRGMLEALGYVE